MGQRAKPVAEAIRVRRVEAGGFAVTEGIHHHGSELPWHHHETPTICFVLKGGFTEMWRGGSIACTSSTMKITPAGERHWDRFGTGDVRGLLIEADDAQIARIRPSLRGPGRAAVVSGRTPLRHRLEGVPGDAADGCDRSARDRRTAARAGRLRLAAAGGEREHRPAAALAGERPGADPPRARRPAQPERPGGVGGRPSR